MKNKMIVILILMALVGMVGNAFANPVSDSCYPASTTGPIANCPGR